MPDRADNSVSPVSARSRLLLSLYVIAVLVCVFWIPTKVPTQPSVSSSYIFGYNNRVGIALLAVGSAVFGLLAYRAGLRFPKSDASDHVSPKLFWICVGLISLVCGILYMLTARLGSFGESAYMINRLGLAAKGLHPYRDFEFAYGAGLLYGPLSLARLLHLSYVNGYYVFWVLSLVAGVWLLRFVIDEFDLPGFGRNAIFLMVFNILLVAAITTGTNYSGLRFLAAPALAIWCYLYLRSERYLAAAGATVISVVLLLLLSPEFAIGFVAGIVAFLVCFWSRVRGWSWIPAFAAALFGIAVILWQADRFDVFHTLKTFANGGISLPIVPAPHILFLVFCLMLSCTLLATEFMERRATSTACLLLITLTSLPSALGHCDPGHVILNGIPFVIVAYLWASSSKKRWLWVGGVFGFLLLLCTATFLAAYAGQLWRASLALRMRLEPSHEAALMQNYRQVMTKRYGTAAAEEKVAELTFMVNNDATSAAPWRPPLTEGIVGAPFGYPFTQERTFIDEGYYSGTANAFNPDQIAAKIEELRQHPDREILLSSEQSCFQDMDGQRKFLSVLLFYPFRWRALHPESLYNPICQYVADNYVVRVAASPDTYGFRVWSPKAK